MATKAKWTMMFYLAGDNNLSTAGNRDLKEMRSVGSTPDVNIVTQFDNAGEKGTQRYHIQRDGIAEHIEELGETDSGDPAVLLDFAAWAIDNYKADRYALVLWNHGSGWEPSEMDRIARSVNAVNYTPGEATERSSAPMARALFRTSIEEIFRQPSPTERAICSDDGTGHSLDTVELGRVLAQIVAELGQPLDLLGMDACLMSNLEVAYQAQQYARYMVASEELEPNDGWPYDIVLSHVVSNPGAPTAELATYFVDAYTKSYVDRKYNGAVTQSAFDLSKAASIAQPLDALADAIKAAIAEVGPTEVWKAQVRSTRFYYDTLWDVAHFCEELELLTSREEVRQAARAVRAAVQTGANQFVIAESHNGSTVEHCGGLSVYLPSAMKRISPYYNQVDYAKNHRWLAMLEAYHTI